MELARIDDAAADLRDGRMVILVDDEDRENEGDLTLAADRVTPEAINFMARHGRGLICLTLPADRCEELGLALQVENNTSPFGTAFTVSIDARRGITTGISAADRCETIRVAIDPRRIGMMGFSNGATYALSIGTANPQLVGTVIAFSPGPAFLGKSGPDQRIFISHGEQDDVLPYSYTRGLVARIRVRKIPLMFESFAGGHLVPRDIRAKALAWFRQR